MLHSCFLELFDWYNKNFNKRVAAHIIENYRDTFIDPFMTTEPVLKKFLALFEQDSAGSPAKSEN